MPKPKPIQLQEITKARLGKILVQECGIEGQWAGNDVLRDAIRKTIQKAINMLSDHQEVDWSDARILICIPGYKLVVTAGQGQHQVTITVDGTLEPVSTYKRVSVKKTSSWTSWFRHRFCRDSSNSTSSKVTEQQADKPSQPCSNGPDEQASVPSRECCDDQQAASSTCQELD